jgi:hypothetical protein
MILNDAGVLDRCQITVIKYTVQFEYLIDNIISDSLFWSYHCFNLLISLNIQNNIVEHD